MTALGVGLIGTGYMGKCHALAWNNVTSVFGDVERPRLVTLAEVRRRLARAAAYDGIMNVTAAYGYYIDDTNAAGWAEYRFGAGRGYRA